MNTIPVRFDFIHAYAQKHGLDYNELCRMVRDAIAEGSSALSLAESLRVAEVCCGEYAKCHRPCTPRGAWQASQPDGLSVGQPAGREVSEDEWVAQVVSSGPHDFPLLQWRSADHSFRNPIGTKLYTAPVAAGLPVQAGEKQHKLTVWFGDMPESNGKANWTAILHRDGADDFDRFLDGITIERSEHHDRVRYEADRVRHLIGELAEAPDILDYDPNMLSPSGYQHPSASLSSSLPKGGE